MVTQIIENVTSTETVEHVQLPDTEAIDIISNEEPQVITSQVDETDEIVFLGSELTKEWYESMKNTFDKRIAAGKKLPNIIILYPWESISQDMIRGLFEQQIAKNQSLEFARVPFYQPSLTE